MVVETLNHRERKKILKLNLFMIQFSLLNVHSYCFTTHSFKGVLTNTSSSNSMLASTKYKVRLVHSFGRTGGKLQKLSSLPIICRQLYYSFVIQLLICAERGTSNQDLKIIWFLYFPTVIAVQFENFCNKSLTWMSH